jgi:hypothetical protein
MFTRCRNNLGCTWISRHSNVLHAGSSVFASLLSTFSRHQSWQNNVRDKAYSDGRDFTT